MSYKHPVEDVYLDSATGIMQMGRALELFQCAIRLRYHLPIKAFESSRLPSWVADWRSPAPCNADISWAASQKRHPWPAKLASDGEGLHIVGELVDVVAEVLHEPLDRGMHSFLTSKGYTGRAMACSVDPVSASLCATYEHLPDCRHDGCSSNCSRYESLLQPGDCLFYFRTEGA